MKDETHLCRRLSVIAHAIAPMRPTDARTSPDATDQTQPMPWLHLAEPGIR